MRKLYFLKYGTDRSKEEMKNLLELRVGSFEEHESGYFGIYFIYKGIYVDRLTIGDNYVVSTGDWIDSVNRYKTIINLSFSDGKNSDKLSKYKYMKGGLAQLESLFLLEDAYREEAS